MFWAGLIIILAGSRLAACESPERENVVGFLSGESFVRVVGYEGAYNLNVGLQVRTWHEDGQLVYHKFSSSGHLKLHLFGGILRCELHPDSGLVVVDQYDVSLSDGAWHKVELAISRTSLSLAVDNLTISRPLARQVRTGPFYLIGGGLHGEPGLMGCLGELSIDGRMKETSDFELSSEADVVIGQCGLTNKCAHISCEHGGTCRHVSTDPHVYCDCDNTGGYTGATCRTSNTWRSCGQYLDFTGERSGQVMVDLDGPGPVPPSLVTCELEAGHKVSVVSHSSMEPTKVDGFQAPGSFSQTIYYSVETEVISRLLHQSASCSQSLRYDCKKSKLFGTNKDGDWRPYGWWISRQGQRMEHWSGAAPGSRQCGCGLTRSCVHPDLSCNCDAASEAWSHDTGLLEDMDSLPVTGLHFGDTGTPLDSKEGRFTLGPLRCVGHTFPGPLIGHAVHLASLTNHKARHCPDVFLEFQLQAGGEAGGVIYTSEAGATPCRLSLLSGGRGLLYEWGAHTGNGNPVTDNTSLRLGELRDLGDGRWHSVNMEHNMMEVSLILDREHTASVTRWRPGARDQEVRASSDLYLKKVDKKVKAADVKIRMFQVNGNEVSNVIEEESEIKVLISNSIIPMEAVHSQTNTPSHLSKFLPLPNLIILISVLSIIVLFVLLITIGVVKFINKNKGEAYYTQEQYRKEHLRI